MFGRFKYCSYICRVNQNTGIMDEKEKESSVHYYNGQLDNVIFHGEFPATIKISGTKWMDLNPISAEEIVKRLIKEFNLEIK
jgi:hypothetical protein